MSVNNKEVDLTIVGGGLAGSEAAWQAAERGLQVSLYEMRPQNPTGAHISDKLGELVCSNSLGSNLGDRASGLLKNELRMLGSLLIKIADRTAVPAGGALAVDRDNFAGEITDALEDHPRISVIREEMPIIPESLAIIASGPLTSNSLSKELAKWGGEEHLYFYDAISPIIDVESIDMNIAFRASRYERGDNTAGDYINCPMNEAEYLAFVGELVGAETIELKAFESEIASGVKAGAHEYFEGCLPIEVIASRGEKSLAFGPMRPVGLIDPRSGRRPHALLQLRQDNLAGSLFNMVGFQTNLTFQEQKRVLRMIPGLEKARFERYGQMHRNTFIHSPKLLKPNLSSKSRDSLLFAGQITGVEGYAGNIGTGLLAGINAARQFAGEEMLKLPEHTMLGALCHYVTHADEANFQPMKANFGILPAVPSPNKQNRRQRSAAKSDRAIELLETYLSKMDETAQIAALV